MKDLHRSARAEQCAREGKKQQVVPFSLDQPSAAKNKGKHKKHPWGDQGHCNR
jgi:hypothetical protein